ncbi:MAG: phage portal protein, partial [Kurthia sp.]
DPINKLIADELNAKFISKADYLKGDRINVIGIQVKSVLELSEAIDKLVASGSFTRNEVREIAGKERSDNPALDEFVLTKNYNSVKGGENKDET